MYVYFVLTYFDFFHDNFRASTGVIQKNSGMSSISKDQLFDVFHLHLKLVMLEGLFKAYQQDDNAPSKMPNEMCLIRIPIKQPV